MPVHIQTSDFRRFLHTSFSFHSVFLLPDWKLLKGNNLVLVAGIVWTTDLWVMSATTTVVSRSYGGQDKSLKTGKEHGEILLLPQKLECRGGWRLGYFVPTSP